MGMMEPNPAAGHLYGKVGDLVFARRADGKIIVRHVPERKVGPTANELANQSRFAQGNSYVKRCKTEPDLYEVYQEAAKLQHKRGCDLASGDRLNPPAINDIDLGGYTGKLGECIRIQAVDDFGVVKVTLTLAQLDGVLLEQGGAVLEAASGKWIYTTTAAIAGGQTLVIHITVADRPGNTVTKTVHHALTGPV